MSMTIKQKALFTGGSLLAAFALTFFLMILPLIKQIQKDSLALIQAKQTSAGFYQEQRDSESFKSDYLKVQNGFGARPALPKSGQALKFIQYLEQSAQATHLYQEIGLLSLKPAGTEKPAEETLDFQISLWGKSPDLIRFLIYLENAPYLNDIRSIHISRLTQAAAGPVTEKISFEAGDVKAIINLSVYQP